MGLTDFIFHFYGVAAWTVMVIDLETKSVEALGVVNLKLRA